MIQMVSYDLQRPGQNYPDLYPAIKSLGTTWWHCLDSVWLIKTTMSSVEVRDQLKPILDSNDELLVSPVGPNWATLGFTDNCLKWLKDNM